MANQIAVYGTLRKGQRAEEFMDGLEYKGQSKLKGATLYKVGWFPGIKLAGNDSSVVVDVFDIPEEKRAEKLSFLDGYEGYDPNRPERSLFIRKEIILDGQATFIYEYNQDVNSKTVIPTGDWLDAKD